MLFLEQEEFDAAILGVAERCGQPPLVVYDRERCLEALMALGDLTYEDAIEYFDFNMAGAWMGPHTPLFLSRPVGEGLS